MATDTAPDTSIEVDIPVGYHRLPLNDIDATFDSAAPILNDLGSAISPETTGPAVDGLRAALHALRDLDAVLCAVGRHNNGDDTYAVSWLVISLTDYGSDRNPRLRIAEIASARRAPNITVFPTAVGDRPVILIESEMMPPESLVRAGRTIPKAHRIEAIVPCGNGRRVSAITLTTLSTDHLPLLRGLLLGMVSSIRFGVAPDRRTRLDLP